MYFNFRWMNNELRFVKKYLSPELVAVSEDWLVKLRENSKSKRRQAIKTHFLWDNLLRNHCNKKYKFSSQWICLSSFNKKNSLNSLLWFKRWFVVVVVLWYKKQLRYSISLRLRKGLKLKCFHWPKTRGPHQAICNWGSHLYSNNFLDPRVHLRVPWTHDQEPLL